MRKVLLMVGLISLAFSLKAQFVRRLEIVPAYSRTVYDMDMTLLDRGLSVKQKSRPQANTVSLALRYRISQRYHVAYAFGVHLFEPSQVSSRYGNSDVLTPQKLSGFSTSIGSYVYPFRFRLQHKFRPYLYTGLTYQAITLRRNAVEYQMEVPANGPQELPTTVSWAHAAYRGGVGGVGAELLIGFNFLDTERFGFSFSLGSAAIYQTHTGFVPQLIYVPRAQLGLVFRTLKTKMPL